MKKALFLAASLTIATAPNVHAQSWWDSIKDMLGMGETTEQQQALPTIDGMVSSVSQQLGISQQQAEAGIASILNFLQATAQSEEFAQLKANLPGIDQVLNAVPDVSQVEAEGVLGSLLQKASEYSESVKAASDLKKQFEAIGLEPSLIQDMVKSAENYLNTPEGQAAKQQLSDLINNLLPAG